MFLSFAHLNLLLGHLVRGPFTNLIPFSNEKLHFINGPNTAIISSMCSKCKFPSLFVDITHPGAPSRLPSLVYIYARKKVKMCYKQVENICLLGDFQLVKGGMLNLCVSVCLLANASTQQLKLRSSLAALFPHTVHIKFPSLSE